MLPGGAGWKWPWHGHVINLCTEMVDIVSSAVRSRMMGGIGRADTQPELIVRSYLHAIGLRFRLYDRRLPGSPDLVFASRRTAVFIHGCFWHQHPGCWFAATPSTRTEFWQGKFAANRARDAAVSHRLTALGWQELVIWECETRNPEALDALAWAILAISEC